MALKFEELRVLQAAELVDVPMPLFTKENLEWFEAIPNS